MNQPSASRSTSSTFSFVALAALGFAVSLGCGKSEAAQDRGAKPEAAPVAAGAKAETDNYVAEMKASGSYAAGKEGTVEVTLKTKGDYHINKQYPYKFKIAEPAPDGVTFPKPMLKREDGTFEEKTGSFKLPFTVAKAGRAKIAGTFSISVCSDANCVMDKVALEVDVDVK
ncbi:MAG: hypothetical protein U0359_11055 [Byssovorax sp.]